MGTKLNRISDLSCQNSKMEYSCLMPHFSRENLMSCLKELDGKKAIGIDGETKENYIRDGKNRIDLLFERMKRFAYRPKPVREVMIPKGDGKYRPLGISTIEDKIIQSMYCKILEAIYEPIFSSCSYGFRKNKSGHKAIKDAINYLNFNNVKEVIDVDLENFFGTIRHDKLLEMLSLKIKDKTFLRYIARILKAGKATEHGIVKSDIGLPQGSILSPVLANIYAHYIIDLWFEKVVPKHIIGKIAIFRYCDDLILCCTDARDVQKVMNSLGKRLGKFGLKLNMTKTKVVKFNRYTFRRGEKQGTFDFLGFSFYLSRLIKYGFVTVKVKTSKKTLRAKLLNVKMWIKQNRFKGGLLNLWKIFCIKLRGHITYFGVTNNSKSVNIFLHGVRRNFFKWMNRRSQKRSFNWKQFKSFEKQYPMPRTKIYYQLYSSMTSC